MNIEHVTVSATTNRYRLQKLLLTERPSHRCRI